MTSMPSRRAGPFYRPELDMLRFFAFVGVFVHHVLPSSADAFPSISPDVARLMLGMGHAGAYGVDLFFALSSYLITELLIREYAHYGRLDIKAFYVRRTLRIWPLYFAFVLFAIGIYPLFFPRSTIGPLYTLSLLTFTANWAISVYGWPKGIVGILWSISIEEQFYIVWPLLIARLGVKRIVHISLAFFVIAWTTRIILVMQNAQGAYVLWCNTFARLDPMAAGAILAVVLRGGAPKLSNASRVTIGLGALLLLGVVSSYAHYWGPTTLISFPIATVCSVLLMVAVMRPDIDARPGRIAAVFVKLGRISYGLYVLHIFALALAAALLRAAPALPAYGVIYASTGFILTIVMATVSYQVIEAPFLRLKKRFTHVASGPVSLTSGS